MTAKAVAQLLWALRFVKSHSRFQVSNGNPFSKVMQKLSSTVLNFTVFSALPKMPRLFANNFSHSEMFEKFDILRILRFWRNFLSVTKDSNLVIEPYAIASSNHN